MYEQIEFTKYICISICLELAKYASMKTMLYCLCIKFFLCLHYVPSSSDIKERWLIFPQRPYSLTAVSDMQEWASMLEAFGVRQWP